MIHEAESRRQESIGTSLRRKGDALRQRDDHAGADEAYGQALESIERALQSLGLDTAEGTDGVDTAVSEKVADLLGVRGGLLRRLDRLDEALASYRHGAAIEERLDLGASYNRTNAVKLALLLGETTLTAARPALTSLKLTFERRLKADEHAADDAWLWADLADCRLLLGQTAEAADAYRLFEQKAESRSPATTLAVLDELAAALRAHNDPLSSELDAGLATVRAALEG